MKYYLIALTLATFLVSCDNQSKKTKNVVGGVEWTLLESEKGKFEIQIPDYPLKEKEEIYDIDGADKTIFSFDLNFQHIEDEHENIAYHVDYSFWPELDTEEAINSKFEDQIAYLISATNGEMLYNKSIQEEEYSGREIYFSVDGKSIVVLGRLIVKNGLFYKVYVVTKEGQLFNNSMKYYLDSFKIKTNANNT